MRLMVMPVLCLASSAAAGALTGCNGPGPEHSLLIDSFDYGIETRVSRKGWMRPVRGKTVVRFGQKKDELRSWGIDIRTGSGAAVVASRGGVVRLAGPFVGLGSTVVIEHDAGRMITLYGKIGSLLVGKGDVVKRGQKVGVAPEFAGEEPVVHFRMFEDGQPVDPALYLP
jgi:lipoprotein NlpD